MRSRKTLGVLGSFAGVASSMAVLAYSTAILLATTSPASAAPNCLTQEIAFVLAQSDLNVAEEIYLDAVHDYGMCMVNTGGPCTAQEINLVLANSDYQVAQEIYQETSMALAMCQSQF